MSEQHKSMPGLKEVTEDLAELKRQCMATHTLEERLEGIPPEKLLAGIPPEKLLAGIPPEKLLAGLSEEQRAELRKLLLKD